MLGNRLKHFAVVLFPVFLALYFYRRSFRIWFLNDDFAWLGLGLGISRPADLFDTLFSPMAQGTIRTLSERLFFLAFERAFGLESLPMRLASFATFAIALVLLVLIVRRLSGSLPAGVLAAVLWSLNFGATIALNWLSSYNQILLSMLVLAAFYSILKYADTGKRRWLSTAWAAYLLGFGALESIIVFPAILLAWAWCFRRDHIRLTLPFFVPALAFTLAHLFWIPKAHDAPAYRMFFDSSLITSLSIYWEWLLASVRLIDFDPSFGWTLSLSRFVLTPALLGFIVWRTFRRDYLPLFLTGFSFALLAPMLPLRDHRTDYYLASASIGMVSVLALIPFRLPVWPGRLAWVLIAIYAVPSFILQQASIEWYLERTAPLRPLLRGLEYAVKLHPGKLILLEGITAPVYDSSLADSALRLLPAGAEIRLVPGSVAADNPLVLAPAAARTAFERQSVVVYRFDGVILRDVTREWERTKALTLSTGLSPELLAGDPSFSAQFLTGWFPVEDNHRWMGPAAQVRLGGPHPTTARFHLKAFAPEALKAFDLTITANGQSIYRAPHHAGPIDIDAPLPAVLTSQTELLVELQSSRSVRPPNDDRTLSLLVTQIAIR